MDDTAVAFLYTLMAALSGSMGVRLTLDIWQNHYVHRPMRPLVMWLAGLFSTQAFMFLGNGIARYHLIATGDAAPWLLSPLWAVLLTLEAVCIVGFYSAFRTIRVRNRDERADD